MASGRAAIGWAVLLVAGVVGATWGALVILEWLLGRVRL